MIFFRVVPGLCFLGATLALGSPRPPAPNAERSHFAEFLIFDNNPAALVELSLKRPEAFAALPESELTAAFDFLYFKAQREPLRAFLGNLYKGRCAGARKDPNRQKFCDDLQEWWNGPLMETFFWDASLVQLSRARELVADSQVSERVRRDQCREAAALVQEIEAKEGFFRPVAEVQLKVFECLGDEVGRLEVYQKLETSRNIQSVLGT